MTLLHKKCHFDMRQGIEKQFKSLCQSIKEYRGEEGAHNLHTASFLQAVLPHPWGSPSHGTSPDLQKLLPSHLLHLLFSLQECLSRPFLCDVIKPISISAPLLVPSSQCNSGSGQD